jgi:two-component system, OmpR family, catabolic regulation response regulator CreB
MPSRVLIVDDDPALARGVQRVLQRALPQCVLEVFHDVERARLRAAEVTFDLAVLDVHVASASGVSLGLALRQVAPGLPIAFMTGEPQSAEASRALTLEPLAILAKPFSIRDLMAAIDRASRRGM